MLLEIALYALPEIEGLSWTPELFPLVYVQFFYCFGWIALCIRNYNGEPNAIDQFMFDLVTVMGFPLFVGCFVAKFGYYLWWTGLGFGNNWIE